MQWRLGVRSVLLQVRGRSGLLVGADRRAVALVFPPLQPLRTLIPPAILIVISRTESSRPVGRQGVGVQCLRLRFALCAPLPLTLRSHSGHERSALMVMPLQIPFLQNATSVMNIR